VLVLAGCPDLFGPGGPKLSVALNLQQPVTPAPILQADVGGRRVELRATSSSEVRTEVRGPRYGEVPVRVALLAAAGDTLGSAAFSQLFQRDHAHWVVALVGMLRPRGHCIGELAVIPVRGTADTLFVMYGSIPEGAVC
jgi:hypothetical protein